MPPVFYSFDRYSARMNLSFFTYATPSVLEGGERSPTIAEAVCFFDSLERTIDFLLRESLICEEMLCPNCDEPMNFPKTFEKAQDLNWRCRRRLSTGKQCSRKLSIFSNSFFFNARLDIRLVMAMMVFFITKMSVVDTTRQLFPGSESKRNTVGKWFRYFREIMAVSLIRDPIQVGGPVRIVEGDEMVVQRRKYMRGSIKVGEQWLFGVVERPINGERPRFVLFCLSLSHFSFSFHVIYTGTRSVWLPTE